jgi:hypothetical protein
MKYTVKRDSYEINNRAVLVGWKVYDGETCAYRNRDISECLAYITLKERGMIDGE